MRSIPIVALLIAYPLHALETIKEYVIVIDPGHGGSISHRKDDKWDPVTNRYLDYYSSGMISGENKEYEIIMDLSRKLKSYLELTLSNDGWQKFTGILGDVSGKSDFERIRFKVHLSREYSWDEKYSDPLDRDTNDDFRLYDFPDREEEPTRPFKPGRISYINSLKPYLVISLHMTPAGRGNPGGMTAVLTPGYRTFDLIRRIHMDLEPVRKFYSLPWMKHGNWLQTENGWSKYQSARADMWVYFHGYRAVKEGTGPWMSKNRGIRYNMVQWRYADPPGWEKIARKNQPGPYSRIYKSFRATGPYWEREKGQPELWKREDGPAGFGGDNHYASDELMRFVQYGVRRLDSSMNTQNSLGPIQTPYVSAYSLPALLNAIIAYIEIGHMNRIRDQKLVKDKADETARSLAAGVYSLFKGLPVPSEAVKSSYIPRGKSIDFKKYENLPAGNYFKIVTD